MIGKTISHYEILSELGAGGMGVVYKARDIELDRHVAMKFLPHLSAVDDHAASRFMVEARSAAKLDHPNVYTIHEVGRSESGQPFIAMAFYEGEDLSERLRQGPLAADEIRNITRQVALGLEAAHQAGIIHRDIKPGNIFMTADGRVKILDFGLAKVDTLTTITTEGSTLGTISYMSPEQADSTSVDTRTDMWSLGVVVYEMLTGTRPFDSAYPQATIYSILNSEPPGLPDESPADLKSIAERCLNKDPDARYSSCADIAELLGAQSIEIRATRKPVDIKSRVLAGVLTMLVLLTGLAYAFSFGPFVQTYTAPTVLILPLEDVSPERNQELLAESFSLLLRAELGRTSDVSPINRRSSRHYAANLTPLPQIREETGIDFQVQSTLSRRAEVVTIELEITDARTGLIVATVSSNNAYSNFLLQSQEVARDLAVELGGTLKSRTSAHNPNLGAMGEYTLGVRMMDQQHDSTLVLALAHFENAIELDSVWALPYTGVARASTILWERHGESPQQAIGARRAEQAMELDSLLAESWLGFGYLQELDDNPRGAIRSYQKAIELDPNLAVAHFWLASMYVVYQDIESSLPAFMEAVRLDPKNLQQRSMLADVHAYLGNWEEVDRIQSSMLDIDPTFNGLYLMRATQRARAGEIDESFALLEDFFKTDADLPLPSLQLSVLALASREAEVLSLMNENPDLFSLSEKVSALFNIGKTEDAFLLLESVEGSLDFDSYRFIQIYTKSPFQMDPRWRAIQEGLGYGPGLLN